MLLKPTHTAPKSRGTKLVIVEFRPSAGPKFSLQIRGHFVDAGLGAFVVPARRSGNTDGSNDVIADFDRQTSGYREHAAVFLGAGRGRVVQSA